MIESQPLNARSAEPDGPALLRIAAQAGSEISERMLETFRAQDLIPRPRRVGYQGRIPQWRYPPGVDRQLIALLRWRQRTKDPDLLKVLLWLDGYEVPVSAIRGALARQLSAITETVERELNLQAQRLGLDPASDDGHSQAIDALAKAMAAKRGTTMIPRHGRLRSADRARAVSLMIRTFGLGETTEGTAGEAAAVERVLGIAPNGRRHAIEGAGPWLTGPAEDLFGAAGIVGLPHMLASVTDASEAELIAARRTVIALFRHLPLMVRMVGVMFGDDNYLGLATMAQISQHPEMAIYVTSMIVAMLRAGWNENLEAITSALGVYPELAEQAQRILDMPAKTIEANLAGQPEDVRERARRLIEAAIEGKIAGSGTPDLQVATDGRQRGLDSPGRSRQSRR